MTATQPRYKEHRTLTYSARMYTDKALQLRFKLIPNYMFPSFFLGNDSSCKSTLDTFMDWINEQSISDFLFKSTKQLMLPLLDLIALYSEVKKSESPVCQSPLKLTRYSQHILSTSDNVELMSFKTSKLAVCGHKTPKDCQCETQICLKCCWYLFIYLTYLTYLWTLSHTIFHRCK